MRKRPYFGQRRTPQEALTDLKNDIYSKKNPSVQDYLDVSELALNTLQKCNPSTYAGQMRLLKDAKEACASARSLHGIPEDEEKSLGNKISLLESKMNTLKKRSSKGKLLPAFLSMAFLLSALLFTSVSLTGYSVFELAQNNSRFIGTIFFICGLVCAFVYFRRKKI